MIRLAYTPLILFHIIARVIEETLSVLENVSYEDAAQVHGALSGVKTLVGASNKDVMNTLRHALTGSKAS